MARRPNRSELRRQRNGACNSENIFWSWYEPQNFGDWITPFLFEKDLNQEAVLCLPKRLQSGATTCFGAGSILRHIRKDDVAIVWGSGIISVADDFNRPHSVKAVRGPRTRSRMYELGYSCPENFGDPGLLLSEYIEAKDSPCDRVGFVPHFVDVDHFSDANLPLGWHLISPIGDVEEVAREISGCDRIVSSSLHGIITAHSFGIPALWVEAKNKIHGDGTKFFDHLEAVDLHSVDGPVRLELAMSGIGKFVVPKDSVICQAKAMLRETCPFHELKVSNR